MKKTPVEGTGASGGRRSSRGNCDRSPYHSKHQHGPDVHTRRTIIHNLSDRQWVRMPGRSRGSDGPRTTPAQLPATAREEPEVRMTLSWRRQSRANPSLFENSLLAANLQGISLDSATLGHFRCPKTYASPSPYGANSLGIGAGNFCDGAGNSVGQSGNVAAGSGILLCPS